VPEYLGHCVSALIVEREYPAFLSAVTELLDAPARRLQMGEAARQSVIEHFDWDHLIDDYRAFFESALRRAPASPRLAVPLREPQAAAHLISPLPTASAADAQEAAFRLEARRTSRLLDAARELVPAVVSLRFEQVTVYGAGEAGCALAEALAWHGITVDRFIDSDPAKQNTRVNGIAVVSLQDALCLGIDCVVIGSFAFADEIRETLQAALATTTQAFVILGAGTAPLAWSGHPAVLR
jgi:hypothetical protein